MLLGSSFSCFKVSAEEQSGLSGFEFQAWICRFYALPPAGLAADELRSNCRLASEARQL
jgi:hypothetical protein